MNDCIYCARRGTCERHRLESQKSHRNKEDRILYIAFASCLIGSGIMVWLVYEYIHNSDYWAAATPAIGGVFICGITLALISKNYK